MLRHYGLDGEQADRHRSGWRYHLLRLAVVCSGSTGHAELVDLFLAAAAESDPVARRGLIDRVCGEAAHFAVDEGDDDYGTPQIAGRLGRLVEQGDQRIRSGPVERRGGVLRAPFAVVNPGGALVADGEIIAAIKDKRLVSARALRVASLGPGHACGLAGPGGAGCRRLRRHRAQAHPPGAGRRRPAARTAGVVAAPAEARRPLGRLTRLRRSC